MSSHRKSRPTAKGNTHPNDEIDALIRWALWESVGNEEPSPEIWDRIKARLEQSEAQPPPRGGRILVAQLSWLVQPLVLGLLILVAFGLSLSQKFDLSLDHEYVVSSELTPQPGSEEVVLSSTDDDMLSGYHLFQLAREPVVFDRRLAP